jgi:hypothetical protein
MIKTFGITKHFIAATLVAAAIVWLSGFAMQTPGHNRNSLARPLKSIQTDKATLFYADIGGDGSNGLNFVELVGESRASTENLKLVAMMTF